MKAGNPCPKCGSAKQIEVEKLFTFGREPLSFYSTDFLGKKARLEAFICKECGYAEFYVKNPDNFRA